MSCKCIHIYTSHFHTCVTFTYECSASNMYTSGTHLSRIEIHHWIFTKNKKITLKSTKTEVVSRIEINHWIPPQKKQRLWNRRRLIKHRDKWLIISQKKKRSLWNRRRLKSGKLPQPLAVFFVLFCRFCNNKKTENSCAPLNFVVKKKLNNLPWIIHYVTLFLFLWDNSREIM